jgi:TolB-like protein
MRKIFISLCFILIVVSPLISQEKMRLAVLELEAKGVSKVIASSVSDLLRTEMVDTGQFTVVERSQMDNILKEHELQLTGCTDNTCAVQLGKILSARKILIGEVNKMGAGLIITTRVVDVEKGTADFASSEKADDLNDIDRATKSLAAKLTERITGNRVVSVSTRMMADEVKNNIVYRASRIRLGITMSGPIQPITDWTKNMFGPFHGALADLFLYRMRNQDGDGLDFFTRCVFNFYEIKDSSELGLGNEAIPYHKFDRSEVSQLGGGIGIRYINKGYYFLDILWQGYLLGYYQYSKGEIEVFYENTGGSLGGSDIQRKKKYTSHGIIGGAGFEIGFSSYFGLFCEYTYGYSKISFPAKDKNLEGGAIRFGVTIRSLYL